MSAKIGEGEFIQVSLTHVPRDKWEKLKAKIKGKKLAFYPTIEEKFIEMIDKELKEK